MSRSLRWRTVNAVAWLYPLVGVPFVLIATVREWLGQAVEEVREDQRLLRILNDESEES